MTRKTQICAVTLAIVAALAAPLAQRGIRERHVVMTVLDRNGRPATKVEPADLTVRENEIAREVLRVEPATDRMQIAVLVDTSAAAADALQDVRGGVQSFVRTLLSKSPESQISIVSFGERPKTESDFSSNLAAVEKGIGRLFPVNDAGAYYMEAITEAVKNFKKREVVRPVIVAFVIEGGPEFSSETPEQVTDALKSIGATLWTISLQGSRDQGMDQERRNRARVLAESTEKSGGGRETILSPMGIKTTFDLMAERLLAQFVVTYARPETLIPPERLEITSKRDGLRILAPRWTGK